MNDPYFEILLHQSDEFIKIIGEVRPIVNKSRSALQSLEQYAGAFCLDLIAHADPKGREHRDFYNNILLSGAPELSAQEYTELFNNHGVEYFDEMLYSRYEVVECLIDYDKRNNTKCFESFVEHFCNMADIFAYKNASIRSKTSSFISEYKENTRAYKASGGKTWPLLEQERNTPFFPPVERSEGELAAQNKQMPSEKMPESRKGVQRLPDVDGQFWIRILIPGIIAGLGMYFGFHFGSVLLVVIGVLFCIVLIVGVKANRGRCPQCRGWNTLITVNSKKVGERKVKVRRNLNSSYFRSSGSSTYATRQVFVNADEYTYSEVYKCTRCGYEMKGTRSVVDDGIR